MVILLDKHKRPAGFTTDSHLCRLIEKAPSRHLEDRRIRIPLRKEARLTAEQFSSHD